MEENVKLTVNIDNFKGIKKCPCCGKTPKQMEWGDGYLKLWCKNPECRWKDEAIVLYAADSIGPLQDLTMALIDKWNDNCGSYKCKETTVDS